MRFILFMMRSDSRMKASLKVLIFLLTSNALAVDADIIRTVKEIDWNGLPMPFVKKAQTIKTYYKVTFFDDFKGKQDQSAESNYCFDQLKPQCTIWSGYQSQTQPCDLSNLVSNDQGPIPPLSANFKSAIYSIDPSINLEGKSLAEVKQTYSNILQDRWKNINKCNWTSYQQSNWMATDYGNPARYSAKMDPTQVTVDPRGKGYLILSARKGKVIENCVFGGTLSSSSGPGTEQICLLKNLPDVILGPPQLYWVDPNPAYPGVYYKAINGSCPHGGSGSVNCRVHAFAPGELSPLIRYGIVLVDGKFKTHYWNSQKFACGINIEYPNGGVVFNQLSCPLLNGGILSQKFVDGTGHVNGFVQKNGIFEAKVRVPRGRGAFPAAWMMPIKGGWPYSGGEIDIMEARDNADETYQTFHQGKCISSISKAEVINDPNQPSQWIDNGNCQKIQGAVSINYSKGATTKQVEAGEFYNRDHLFSVEWSDSKIRFLINNVQSNEISPGTQAENYYFNNPKSGLSNVSEIPSQLRSFGENNMPHDPFYWILNHSTYVDDANIPQWTQQDHYIDYIRVYDRCISENDFCPRGGVFVEGTGCVSPQGNYSSPCTEKFPQRFCPAGGTQTGSTCQVKKFDRPVVVPGVKYWIDADPNYPGVYYAKINAGCPFGGAAGVNCQFEGLPQVLNKPQGDTVLPGIDYWVDADPRWPGIYYKKIGQKCPVGGSGEVNCQLKPLPSGFLNRAVKYWVDTDPRWPGIYYRKINGACPFGGSGEVNCQLLSLSVPSFYLNPKVKYWLDTDPRWPGIYYSKINNACPFGGSAGVNCQIKSYPVPTKPYVVPNVKYWVDANPEYPGVYYAKIGGNCPWGGSVGVNCQLISFSEGVLEQGVKYWVDPNPIAPGVYYQPDFRSGGNEQ
jgi:beta-glucanase (GH16 family)